MAEPLRLGLLSTARINGRILAGAGQTELVDVVAVASRDGARAEAFAREHGIARPYSGYEALLADPGVDAVYLPLPNSLHVEWTARALEAGKHVLCEKPFTDEPDDAERLFDLAEAGGLVLTEGFMYRHNPQTRRWHELVREGAIGRLQLVRTSFSFPVQGAENIRLDPALHGGAFFDLGCYCVSGIRLLAGEPGTVFGRQAIGPTGVDELFTGSLVFADEEVHGVFDCGLRMPFRASLEAVGTEGLLLVDDPWLCRGAGIELRRGETPERIPVESADSYRLELEDLARAVAGESAPLLGREECLAQARTLSALRRSAAQLIALRPSFPF